MRLIGLIVSFLVSLLLIIFLLLNQTPVTINYVVGYHQIALSLLLLIVFFIGFFSSALLMVSMVYVAKSQCRQLKKRLHKLEQHCPDDARHDVKGD